LEDNIKSGLKEMEFGGVDWIELVLGIFKCEDAVNTVTSLRFL